MFDAAKYTVGWICALPVESAAALALLDEEYEETAEVAEHDNNSYFLGRIRHHNVVIAGLPDGEYGIASAASVANNMLHSFPYVRIGLMVGIGGGAPMENKDIRLGDVVVSSREGQASGVFQYDFGKVLQDKDTPFAHTGLLNQPPVILRTAVSSLKTRHKMRGHGLHGLIKQTLENLPQLNDEYSRPSPDSDRCYRSTFVHSDTLKTCEEVCGNGTENVVEPRPARKEPDEPEIHYGQIASGNSLMKDATVRDRLAKEHNILCFEMEAAGLMNHFPCLVIRGICDYSDSHKNKKWQGYASMVAASYAKEVLSMIPKSKVERENRLADDATPAQTQNISDSGRGWQTHVSGGTSHLYQGDHATINHHYGQIGGHHHAAGEDEITKYLDALKTDVNYDLQKDRNIVCAPGTGEWFFHHPEYEAFEKAKGSQLLFVTAEAGGGKSTTMRTLVDKLQASPEPPLVAYFFFKDDDDSLRSYDGALSTLIYQLLVGGRGLTKLVKKQHQKYGNALRHNTKVLWKIILDVAAEVNRGVMCIMDALDECAALDRKQLVADLLDIFNSESQIPPTSQLKFVVTSRPYEDRNHPYSDLFEGPGNIRVLAGENAQVSSDLRNVIRFKAEELAQKRQLSQDVQDLLISRLSDQNRKSRSFLAVRMAFELMDLDQRLHKDAGKRTVEIILSSIPQELGDQFDEMLARSGDRVHTRRLLCVLLAARKTLKIPEFKVIYALTQPANDIIGPAESYDELEMPTDDEQFKRLVRSRCGLFITFIRNSVHLFHQTAREHLMAILDLPDSLLGATTLQAWEEREDARRMDNHSWKGCISRADANVVCLTICLDILTFNVPQNWVEEVFDSLHERNDIYDDIRMFASDRPLFLYAACNWHEHLVLGGNNATLQLMKLRYSKILDVGEPAFWVWFLALSNDICSNRKQLTSVISSVWEAPAKAYSLKPMYGQLLRGDCLGKLFNMDEDLHLLLGSLCLSPKPEELKALEETQRRLTIGYNSSQTNRSQWRAAGGYELIDKFHIASREYEFTTASQAVLALEEGKEERGMILSKTIPKSTLLWTCIASNMRKTLRRVLASVHDLRWLHEVPDHLVYGRISQQTRIITYGGGGIADTERLRNERQNDLKSRWPPACVVMFKARKRHSPKPGNAFEILADWIEASSRPSHNAQKLWEAGGFFDSSLCCRLVRSGVHVDHKIWKDGRTALQCAAGLWEHDLIQVLIGLSADPSIISSNGCNALHWFLLPKLTSDLRNLDISGTSMVRTRTQTGDSRYEKCHIGASVRALSQSSTIEAPLSDGTTPLMLAVRYSATATKVLLAEQVDLDKKDDEGRTALMHFFDRGLNGRSVKTLKRLLCAGADSLTSDSQDRTTLAYWGNALMREGLLSLSPEVNSFNISFHQLASTGPVSRRDVLIEQLKIAKIPLVAAALLGNAELCWALMESGVNPDEHGIPEDSDEEEDSISLPTELDGLAWNPVMVALHKGACVTAAILFAYGADVGFQTPKRKRLGLDNGMTPLHVATRDGDPYSGYYSRAYISLFSGERDRCAFSVATHANHSDEEDSSVCSRTYDWKTVQIDEDSTNANELDEEDSSSANHSVKEISLREVLDNVETRDCTTLKDKEDDVSTSDSEYETQNHVPMKGNTKAPETPFDTLFGARFMAKSPCGPLLEAIIHGKLTASDRQEVLIKYMLQSGAPVNVRTQRGLTPLFIAVSRCNLSLITLLLKYGADPNVAAVGGCTPLIMAAKNGRKDIVNILITSGANVNAQSDPIEPDKCPCAQFVDRSSFMSESCYVPLTALVVASDRGHYDVVEALIGNGADVNLPIEHHVHGRLPTRREIRHRGRFTCGRSKSPDSSDTDPEPDPKQWKGYYSVGTALTCALGDVRKLLLRHGADPTKEVALRRCDCQVIKERELEDWWSDELDTE